MSGSTVVLDKWPVLGRHERPNGSGCGPISGERGPTPLFWSHVLPYGEVKLNINSRLALGD